MTVDYYSNYWEIDRLQETNSTAVIKKLKGHFARYGCPEQVVSDNGPQFASTEFASFAESWDFEHLTSSPGYSRSNGKAESAVKTAKRVLRKARESNSDPYMALLDVRNTPSQDTETSPAQKLMNRRMRTLLPTTHRLLQPHTVDGKQTKLALKIRQQRQAKYYNQSARDLPVLEEGEIVRMKPYRKGQKQWEKATITRRLDERSYDVETDTGTFRRNRNHLRKTNEKDPEQTQTTPIQMDTLPTTGSQRSIYEQPSMNTTQNEQSSSTGDKTMPQTEKTETASVPMRKPENANSPVKTRSGRVVKKPQRFQ